MRQSTHRQAPRPVRPAAAALSKMLSRAWSLPPQRNFVAIERNVQVPMSDGTVLLADHYLPITSRPAATVLVRCPYGRGAPFSLLQAQLVAERGFHGIVRLTEADPLAGTVRVPLIAAAHRFGRGHRLRLQVAGGGHPRFARNPGNGQVDAPAKDFAVTHYSIQSPSALVVSQTAGKEAAHV
jgi:predicted acyl esterase